jgi:hypothetical protein
MVMISNEAICRIASEPMLQRFSELLAEDGVEESDMRQKKN